MTGLLVKKFGPAPEAAPYRAPAADLYLEAAVMLIVAAFVYPLGENTRAMSIIFGVILVLRFALLYRRGDLIIFFLGVCAGGGNDVLSMYKGVYQYLPPSELPVPIPLWMVIFWGEAFLFFRKLMRYGRFLGPDQKPKPIDPALALDLVIVIAYRMIIYRTAATAWLPDALFAAILVVRLLVIPPLAHERAVMLVILVLGPLYEIILIGGGLYLYQTPVFFGMPLWLIVYWVFIFRFLKAVIDRMEHFIPLYRAA